MLTTIDEIKIKTSITSNKDTEGWLTERSEVVMHCLLNNLPNVEEKRDFLELGVWKGKSANVLQAHNDGVNLYLLDKINSLNNFKFGKNTIFLQKDINYLNNDIEFLSNKLFSVIHEDTLHSSRTTLAGLELASKLLTDSGIYMIDDFNISDFTVMSTTITWLERRKDFSIFLLDGQKAYLTRTEALPIWYNYCVRSLQDDYTKITGKYTRLRNRQNIKDNTALALVDSNNEKNQQEGQYWPRLFSCFGEV